MRKVMLAVLIAACSGSTWAQSGLNDTTVESIKVEGNRGYARFTTTQLYTLVPCAASHNQEYAFDLTSNGGKSIYALLAAAKMSGAKLLVRGTGTCTKYADFEDWSYGYFL